MPETETRHGYIFCSDNAVVCNGRTTDAKAIA